MWNQSLCRGAAAGEPRRSPGLRFAEAALLGMLMLWLPGAREAAAGQDETPAAQDQAPDEQPRSATMPFTLDHNRLIVEIEFTRPDGTSRRARAWMDTGSQYLLLSEPLARDLGLDLPALQAGGHSVELTSPAPPVRLGGLPLPIEGVRMRVHPGVLVRPGVPAEANLPASLLRHDHIVIDYPAQRLTVARPGVLEPRGAKIPCRVNSETGLFMIAATIDGETVQLGVDNGSAGTWVSNTLTAKWMTRHPTWPHAAGAAGSANFFGFPFEAEGVLMLLPELELGGLRAQNVALLGLDQSMFDWYSRKSAGPVVGFIGANVLKDFRLEIDFPDRMTYWEEEPSTETGTPAPAGPGRPVEPNDLDIVGLTLRAEPDGGLTVAGVVKQDGKPAVEGVRAGDKLIRVDDLDVATATMGAVVDALRGTPGSTRTLVLEREGKRVTVEAKVLRLPHR